jgi:hypothetical protein
MAITRKPYRIGYDKHGMIFLLQVIQVQYIFLKKYDKTALNEREKISFRFTRIDL